MCSNPNRNGLLNRLRSIFKALLSAALPIPLRATDAYKNGPERHRFQGKCRKSREPNKMGVSGRKMAFSRQALRPASNREKMESGPRQHIGGDAEHDAGEDIVQGPFLCGQPNGCFHSEYSAAAAP